MRHGNILLLRGLVPGAQENNQFISLQGGIDAIPGTKINFQFNDSLANGPMIAEISHFCARDSDLDLGGRLAIAQGSTPLAVL
jgi:hypothetical protein